MAKEVNELDSLMDAIEAAEKAVADIRSKVAKLVGKVEEAAPRLGVHGMGLVRDHLTILRAAADGLAFELKASVNSAGKAKAKKAPKGKRGGLLS